MPAPLCNPDEPGARPTENQREGNRVHATGSSGLKVSRTNIYSFGGSEKIVGRALKQFARRDDIVLATKVHQHMHDGPGGSGLSRKAIMEQIDASLTRLDTDYIDLYQIHRFDPGTPVEETMEALHDVVKVGKARYLGASSMWAWQFSKMQHVAEANGWTRFVSMQNQYSVIHREEEREMFGLLADQGVGRCSGRQASTASSRAGTISGRSARAVRAAFPASTQSVRKLRARLHVELAEDLAQVVFDRARADEQLRGYFSVGVSLRYQA